MLNSPLLPALDAQSSVNGRHTDMQAIPCHMALAVPEDS